MATVLRMPEVAAAATEAVLTEWLLPEGATFAASDALATVETEKALVDIEADADGTLLKLLVPGGKLVDVGAPIAVLAAVGEQVTDLASLLTQLGLDQDPGSGAPVAEEAPATSPPVEAPAETRAADPTVVEARAADPTVVEARAADPTVVEVRAERASKPPAPGVRVFSSPLARKIAKGAGLAIEDIPGTGPRNRVLRRDVEAVIAARASAPPPPSVGTSHDEIPHTRLRKAMAARLQQSKREAPHFYLRATVRVDRLVTLRAEVNEGSDTRVSLNDLVVKAVGGAHARVPEMNATWAEDAVRRPHSVDVAVAVATERGLVTPVVRDVPGLTVTALAARVQDLAARARDGKLKQEELEGGTISVTNLGMYGVEEFAAIINPPHAAILAVGAVRDEPVVEDGVLVVGKTLKVTLSVDHRPVDGVVAAQWLGAFVDLLEHPARVLA
ncbi:MAG: dihydrolipoamide acetyltransferase family protein [Nocardioides sp.]|nr:dihydrolipoamide acetyltransferase family protein [Nocardioides sp.]